MSELPKTGTPDVEIACDWCGKNQISYANPPAHVMCFTDHGMPSWRVCQTCVGLFTEFVNWRKHEEIG